VDRGAVILAPGPHDGGRAARDLALLHAPERASDRSGIEPENLASRRLAAKLGFTEEGTLRDWLCVAGEFRSVVMYSLLPTEWMARA